MPQIFYFRRAFRHMHLTPILWRSIYILRKFSPVDILKCKVIVITVGAFNFAENSLLFCGEFFSCDIFVYKRNSCHRRTFILGKFHSYKNFILFSKVNRQAFSYLLNLAALSWSAFLPRRMIILDCPFLISQKKKRKNIFFIISKNYAYSRTTQTPSRNLKSRGAFLEIKKLTGVTWKPL